MFFLDGFLEVGYFCFDGYFSGSWKVLLDGLDTLVLIDGTFLEVGWFCWMGLWRSDAFDRWISEDRILLF